MAYPLKFSPETDKALVASLLLCNVICRRYGDWLIALTPPPIPTGMPINGTLAQAMSNMLNPV